MHPSSEQTEIATEQGSARVAQHSDAMEGLESLAGRPLHEHAEVYEQVHARLQSALSEIDDA